MSVSSPKNWPLSKSWLCLWVVLRSNHLPKCVIKCLRK
uniref:Uncharacterized protein n=1 Tax=Anguilla anguilla TaxID=7936 RepID=A0A0E9QJR7_ANGAN